MGSALRRCDARTKAQGEILGFGPLILAGSGETSRRSSMRPRPLLIVVFGVVVCVLMTAPARAQFFDGFDGPSVAIDRTALAGWSFVTGGRDATMRLHQGGDGYASIVVDARRDRRNVWWALIERRVSDSLDLERLALPGYELRIEARVRLSHAPRRVNMHVNTNRTTDFHSHLMEFDVADTGWHTISMTTREFSVYPGDTVFNMK
jgi:hypothetical protein